MSSSASRLRVVVFVVLSLVAGATVGAGAIGLLDGNGFFGGDERVAQSGDAPASDAATESTPTPAGSTTSTATADATTSTADSATPAAAGPAATPAPTTPRPSAASNATWEEYRLVAVFRNDDIKPQSDPSTMHAVDQVFAEEGVPVTNAVIPFARDRPISDSEETCTYLRELRRDHPTTFEFALHGYTHENRSDFYASSEFGSVPYDTQREWIESGLDELEACTGERPTAFVPPMNTYDENTTRALNALGVTTVSGGSWFTQPYYGERGVFREGGLVHVSNTAGYVTNWTTMETKSRAQLRSEFDSAYAEGGTYVMMLHYQQFDAPERRADLRAHLRYTKSKSDVRYMTVGELGSRLSNGTMERTEEGWRVLEPAD